MGRDSEYKQPWILTTVNNNSDQIPHALDIVLR